MKKEIDTICINCLSNYIIFNENIFLSFIKFFKNKNINGFDIFFNSILKKNIYKDVINIVDSKFYNFDTNFITINFSFFNCHLNFFVSCGFFEINEKNKKYDYNFEFMFQINDYCKQIKIFFENYVNEICNNLLLLLKNLTNNKYDQKNFENDKKISLRS